jgi:hypothetical protein
VSRSRKTVQPSPRMNGLSRASFAHHPVRSTRWEMSRLPSTFSGL